MSAVVVNEVLRGFYLDSVALLRMSQSLVALDGVDEAAMMMGSPSNRQIMADAGILDAAGEAAEGGDLVIDTGCRDVAELDGDVKGLRIALASILASCP